MQKANIKGYITKSNPLKLKKEESLIRRLVKLTLIDLAVAMMVLTLGMPVFAGTISGPGTAFAEKFTGFMSGILSGEAVSKPDPGSSHPQMGSRSGWLYAHHFQLASRGELSNYPAMKMEATAYEPSPRSCGPNAHGVTATGMRAMVGVVAVDPRVIPLGSKLYVEGYGYAIAADTGGAIKGNRIDVFYNTIPEALQWGRKMVRVYILGR